MTSLRDVLQYYGQNQWMLAGLVICCAVALFLAWKTRCAGWIRLCAMLILPAALVLVLVLNPVSTHFALMRFSDSEVQRFLWIVPMSLILAVCIVLALGKIPGTKLRAGAFGLVCCAVLLYAGGFPRLRATWMERTDNWYKVPQIVVDLCDSILADEAPEKTAIFPLPLNLWVRQYSPEIRQPFAWIHTEKEMWELYELYGKSSTDPVDLNELGRLARENGYTYIVLSEQRACTGDLSQSGYVEVCRLDAYPDREDSPYYQTYILYREE